MNENFKIEVEGDKMYLVRGSQRQEIQDRPITLNGQQFNLTEVIKLGREKVLVVGEKPRLNRIKPSLEEIMLIHRMVLLDLKPRIRIVNLSR
jgi:hypothetical protein